MELQGKKYHRLVSNVAMDAWFVSNNNVKAEKMNVTATADVKFLEIQNAKGTIKKPLSLSPGLS